MNQSLQYEIDAVMPEAVATTLFTALASFFDRIGGDTPVADSMGQVDQTQVPVAGLQSIVSMFSAARNSISLVPDEGMRTPSNYTEEPEYHLLLNGYYPNVLPRFTVQIAGDATVYEITPGTVQSDSQKTQTRCKLRRYSL
jgi:hypothetical protein